MGSLYRFNLKTKAGEIELVERKEFSCSFDEVSMTLPVGAYATFRTYGGCNAFHLEDHINRLLSTLRVAIYKQVLIKSSIRSALKLHILTSTDPDRRIRLIIPLTDLKCLYILTEGLVTPSIQDYTNGVEVITAQLERVEPDRKQTGFIHESLNLRKQIKGVVKEVLLVGRHGYLLEGISSNAFFVKAGEVYTAGSGVLEGVTRKIVLDVCAHLEMSVNYSTIYLEDLTTCDEAFITSTSRGVLPVVKIDHTIIGLGHPGAVTRKIMEEFNSRIEEGLEAF